jgi:hypothetical protein
VSTTAGHDAHGTAATPAAISRVRFTEEMKGHVTFGETDFDRGDDPARDGSTPIMFHLTIEIEDLDRFASDPGQAADAHGYVGCEALGGRLPIERGIFNLFVDAGPRTKRMLYRLLFCDGVGHPLTLTGFKVVRDDPGFDVWRDTTTLYTRVLRGHVVRPEDDEAADVVASGIIRITIPAFARQLTTFRASGPSVGARLAALAAFGRLFMGQLASVYLRRRR